MIVVSILAHDGPALRARALAQVPHADALELRLDTLASLGDVELRALITAIGKPVIVAVNGPEGFGSFAGPPAERFALLERAARAGAAFVDVDWRLAREQGALPSGVRRIVSRHVADETPADLRATWADLRAAAARPGDLPKLVPHARCAEDGVRLLELARALPGEFVAFASGERGSFTRVLAPIFGSRFTYAAPARIAGVDTGSATAPGQLRADEVRSHWPLAGPTRATQVFAVLGLPARHSLSPRLHNAVFRANDRDAVYVAMEPERITELVALSTAPNWRGFSVTAPFKEAAWGLAEQRCILSRECAAANTLVRTASGWSAHNTDVEALSRIVADVTRGLPTSPRLPRVLIVGNGGAARAAVQAAGPSEVHVTARDPDRAARLAGEMRVRAIDTGALERERFDVVIHCTPAGSRTLPNQVAVPASVVRSARVLIEAVYRPARTPLVEIAEAAGVTVVPGSRWFLEQAVLQAFHFSPQGVNAHTVMRAVLERALAEDPA